MKGKRCLITGSGKVSGGVSEVLQLLQHVTLRGYPCVADLFAFTLGVSYFRTIRMEKLELTMYAVGDHMRWQSVTHSECF